MTSIMKTIHLVDASARDIVGAVPLFDPDRQPLEIFRQQLLASYAMVAPPMSSAREEVRIVGTPTVRALIYRPKEATPSRAVLYIHGGGFIGGSAEMTDAVCVAIAEKHKALVVSVDYALAPENPFPGPVDQCYTALRWLLNEAPARGIDPSRIVIMGHSAGGGLAAATALLHRDRGGAPLAGQVLIYPMLDARTGTSAAPIENESTGEFGWTRGINRFAWNALRGREPIAKEREGHFSPALAVDLRDLPPTFLAVGSVDLFLEEDVNYGMRLSRAGVPVDLHVYVGGIHGFDFFPSAIAERLAADVTAALTRLLG